MEDPLYWYHMGAIAWVRFMGLLTLIIPVLGFWVFWEGFSILKRRKIIEGTPMSKIRSIAMGFVNVSGKVSVFEKKPLKSPFTGKNCVYFPS